MRQRLPAAREGLRRWTLHRTEASGATQHAPVWLPGSPVQSACPKAPSVTCCPLLYIRLNLLGRGGQEWVRTGTRHTAPHCCHTMHSCLAGKALHHAPAHLGQRNPRATELRHSHIHMCPTLLPSTAVIIRPKEKTWLWLCNRSRRPGHYFARRL